MHQNVYSTGLSAAAPIPPAAMIARAYVLKAELKLEQAYRETLFGCLSLREGEGRAAEAHFRKAVALDPEQPDGRLGLGDTPEMVPVDCFS